MEFPIFLNVEINYLKVNHYKTIKNDYIITSIF